MTTKILPVAIAIAIALTAGSAQASGRGDRSTLVLSLAPNLAVQCVLDGGMFFSATVPPPVPSMLTSEPSLPRVGADCLSEREQQVVRLVARGLVSNEVADQLGLSTRTVEKHRARILAKLGLHDVPMLVRWCLRNGLG